MVDFLDSLFRRTPGPTGKNDSADPSAPNKVPNTPAPLGSGNTTARTLQTLAKVDAMIAKGKSMGLVYAPENLQHWRNGSGTLKIMPAAAFSNEKFINDWLKANVVQKFRNGTENRLKSGVAKRLDQISMHFESARDLYAPFGSDLFFALGGFTLRSEVIVQGEDVGGGTIFQFKRWTCKASDVYNWDPGKTTWVPGFGTVTDEELHELERAGYGKSFNVESETWTVTDKSILQEFSISGF
jgi:hypothetical protein